MKTPKSAFLAMTAVVAASNYLVQFPINDWLTFGAFTYPFSYLVTELTNRFHGPTIARKTVYLGFALAVALSLKLATPRIALASGSAYLISQLLDIYVFNRLRQSSWWIAPLSASILASTIDTFLFWPLAFYGEPLPVFSWACGDLSVKFMLDFLMLTPFRFMIRRQAT